MSKNFLSVKDTNFVAVSRESRELFSALNGTQLEEDAVKTGINWTFNPPGVPHFGRVSERLVRSCKKALWNNLGSDSLKAEQLTTIDCSLKKRLDNRPLTASSSDAENLKALTPNLFIFARSTFDHPNVVFNGRSTAMNNAFWAHSQIMKKI